MKPPRLLPLNSQSRPKPLHLRCKTRQLSPHRTLRHPSRIPLQPSLLKRHRLPPSFLSRLAPCFLRRVAPRLLSRLPPSLVDRFPRRGFSRSASSLLRSCNLRLRPVLSSRDLIPSSLLGDCYCFLLLLGGSG